MAFELISPELNKMARGQTTAKLTVTQQENGRTFIRLSGALRDWLEPTPCPTACSPRARKMQVTLLVDRAARQIMVVRAADHEQGKHLYRVGGLGKAAVAYISDWNLDTTIGLQPGCYPAELMVAGGGPRGALVSLDARMPPAAQNPGHRTPKSPAQAEPPLSRVKLDEHEHVAVIRGILGQDATIMTY